MNVKEMKNVKRIQSFDGEFAIIATADEKWGIINRQGELVLEPEKCEGIYYSNFDSVYEVFYLRGQGRKKFDAEKREFLSKAIFMPVADSQYIYEVTGDNGEHGRGVCDAQFNDVIVPAIRIVYRNGLYWVKRDDGLWGAVNPQGEIVLPYKYENVVVGSEHERTDQVVVKENGLYYLIDDTGKHLTNGYDFLRPFNKNGYAIAVNNGEFVIVDRHENIVATLKDIDYDTLTYWCSPNRIAYSKNGKYGLMSEDGKIITEPIYEGICMLNHKNFIRVYTMDGKTMYINSDGQSVLEGFDFAIYWFKYNVFEVKKNHKYGIYDGNGNEIIPCEYDYIGLGNTDGLDLIAVCKDGRCYFINWKQEEVKLW